METYRQQRIREATLDLFDKRETLDSGTLLTELCRCGFDDARELWVALEELVAEGAITRNGSPARPQWTMV